MAASHPTVTSALLQLAFMSSPLGACSASWFVGENSAKAVGSPESGSAAKVTQRRLPKVNPNGSVEHAMILRCKLQSHHPTRRRTISFHLLWPIIACVTASFAISSSPDMFEKYTEPARRVIFFAPYEARKHGSPYIEPEHLLLGICRDSRAMLARMLGSNDARRKLEETLRERCPKQQEISASVDLPLSNEFKRVLAFAAEEAERLNHRHIRVEHQLLGLLREEGCEAAHTLGEFGLTVEMGRVIVGAVGEGPAPNLGHFET